MPAQNHSEKKYSIKKKDMKLNLIHRHSTFVLSRLCFKMIKKGFSSLPESALIIKKKMLYEIVRAFLKGYYSFSPKYLTFLTNPNNREKLTPIAQHSPRDRLILQWLACSAMN